METFLKVLVAYIKVLVEFMRTLHSRFLTNSYHFYKCQLVIKVSKCSETFIKIPNLFINDIPI